MVAAVFFQSARGHTQARAVEDATLEVVQQEGIAACPTANALKNRVHAELGYVVFGGGSLRYRVSITQNGSAYQALVSWADGSLPEAQRVLTSDSCAALFDAVALTIALSIDPLLEYAATQTPAHPTTTEGSVETTRDGSGEEQAPRTEAQPSVAQPWTLRMGLGSRASLGMAPLLGIGGTASLSLQQRLVSFGLEGNYEFGPSTSIDTGAVQTSLIAGGISGCGHLDWFALCGAFFLGAFQAEGIGFSQTTRGSNVYAGFAVRAVAEHYLAKQVFAFLGLEANLNIVQSELRVSGATVWRMPFAAAAIRLGLGFDVDL